MSTLRMVVKKVSTQNFHIHRYQMVDLIEDYQIICLK